MKTPPRHLEERPWNSPNLLITNSALPCSRAWRSSFRQVPSRGSHRVPSLLPVRSLGCSWQAPPKVLALSTISTDTRAKPQAVRPRRRWRRMCAERSNSFERTTPVEKPVSLCVHHESLAWHHSNISGTPTVSRTCSIPGGRFAEETQMTMS